MKKRVVIIAAVVVGILFAFSMYKDAIIKSAVEKGAEYVTGLRLTTSRLAVGLIRPVVDIRDLKLYNPAQFAEKTMIDMPKAYVHYEFGSFFRKKIHIYEIDIELKTFDVVKNKNGALNLNSLKMSSGEKRAEPSKKPDAAGAPPQFKIDKLHLKVGMVRYTDYTSGQAVVREYPINIDEVYNDIEDPTALVSLIIMRSLVNTSIANLANFDLGPIKNSLGAPLQKAQKVVADMKGIVRPMLDQTGPGANAAVKKTEETITKTTEALSGMLGSFGEKKSQ